MDLKPKYFAGAREQGEKNRFSAGDTNIKVIKVRGLGSNAPLMP